MQIKQSLMIACVLTAASGVAGAQAPPTPATPPAATAPPAPVQPNDCTAMKGTTAPGVTTGQGSEPLGDKLARTDGVLCPPSGVDPEMRAPTPDNGNKMPVIPPPGSPGGDPTVRPK
jgi:hypothetical protein